MKFKKCEKKVVTIRVPIDILEKLETYCNRFRVKKSRVINKLLFQFLK